MTFSDKGHVHRTRVINNSCFEGHQLHRLMNWSKQEVKYQFLKGMAFANNTDTRSYAQVAASNLHVQGTRHMGSNSNDNDISNRSHEGSAGVVFSQVLTQKAVAQNINKPPCVQSIVPQLFEPAGIPIWNRFKVLESLNSDSVEVVEDCANNSLPVTSPGFKRTSGKSRFFGHSVLNKQDVPFHDTEVFTNLCEQIGTKLGCIPSNHIALFDGTPTYWEKIPDIIQAHKLIRDSGLPNFLGLRIPVGTRLKVQNWRHYLAEYFDQQLPDLIEFGFPLDFDRKQVLGITDDNHPSAKQFPEDIEAYISEELSYGAMMGPFNEPPFPLHISPFLTRDKPGSGTRRTIMDLSWPKKGSVNDGVASNKYLGTEFHLHYPSIDDFVKRVVQLGPACKIFKVDISRAFRHLRIDPGDVDLLGLRHKGQIFVDLSLPFGFRLGSIFFQKISDSIRYIMKNQGHPHLLNYIDDLCYCELPSKIDTAYQCLLRLLQDLGLDISVKKLNPPATKVVCLGILFDTVTRTISIPADKLQSIVDLCKAWVGRISCTKTELQSLLGSLLYISKCVRPARFFLNRMLQVLRDNTNNRYIVLTKEFQKDLNWFSLFLTSYNGVTMYDSRPISKYIYLDASLTGLGGIFGNQVYTLPLPVQYRAFNIAHLEMLNVVVAFKVWGSSWANQKIQINCDNMAVVEVLQNGYARDSYLAACARNIWLLMAMFNISVDFIHISGKTNCAADLLSRWQNTAQDFEKISAMVSDPIWVHVHPDLLLLNHDI